MSVKLRGGTVVNGKRKGGVYWYRFQFGGECYRRSCHTSNQRVAEQVEAAARVATARGEAGIAAAKKSVRLSQFLDRVAEFHKSRFATREPTLRYYTEKCARLRRSKLAELPLARIGAEQIAAYTLCLRRELPSINAANHLLAVLRRVLRLAHAWGELASVPPVPQIPGGRQLEEVLPREAEAAYLAAMAPEYAAVCALVLHTTLRPKEALALRWADVDLPGGWLSADNKGRARKRIPLTAGARRVLEGLPRLGLGIWGDTPPSHRVIERAHRNACRTVGLPDDLKLHGLRHTAGTRMGAAGVDAFSLQAIMGHSKVTTTQRYVHPQGQALQSAARLVDAAAALGVGTKAVTGRKEPQSAVAAEEPQAQ